MISKRFNHARWDAIHECTCTMQQNPAAQDKAKQRTNNTPTLDPFCCYTFGTIQNTVFGLVFQKPQHATKITACLEHEKHKNAVEL